MNRQLDSDDRRELQEIVDMVSRNFKRDLDEIMARQRGTKELTALQRAARNATKPIKLSPRRPICPRPS